MVKGKGAGHSGKLRIIAGEVKGRKLNVPSGVDVRPTQDRIRESLFTILGDFLADRVVLDLFAGSGALGIEALSRGAGHVTFVDHSPVCARTIRKNLERCGFLDRAEVLRGRIPETFSKIQKAGGVQYDLVLLDPPYNYNILEKEKILHKLNGFYLLKENARIVFEHFQKDTFGTSPEGFIIEEQRRYGDTMLTFFKYVTGEKKDHE